MTEPLLNMETTKAQVVSVTNKMISVIPLIGPFKDKLYGLPPRAGVTQDQFVAINVHPSGHRAEWATIPTLG